jgi:hypothetical protein
MTFIGRRASMVRRGLPFDSVTELLTAVPKNPRAAQDTDNAPKGIQAQHADRSAGTCQSLEITVPMCPPRYEGKPRGQAVGRLLLARLVCWGRRSMPGLWCI